MASFQRSVVGAVVWGGLLAGACAAGQAPAPKAVVVTEPPVPLLRAQAGDLKTNGIVQGSVAQITADTLEPGACEIHLGAWPGAHEAAPCVAILQEDGLTRLAGADYGSAKVSAFEFVDATGAYSAYTYYRSLMKSPRLVGGEARLRTGSTETSADAAGTVVWAGTVVLRVTGRATREELVALVSGLPKVGGAKGLAPLLPTELVSAGLEGASVRYALGPVGYQAMGGALPAQVLGWDKSVEVATADYSGKGGSRGQLTLLMYPTPQIAGDRGRALEQAVKEAGVDKFGTLRMRRVGPMLGVTTGAWTVKQAESTVAALNLDQQVTFDKKKPPEFHAEVRKTASLLQNIAVLSGVLIAAAVLLGLFLGFGRAGIRVLMGKPAASEPEFLSINLRDKPKALFAGKEEKRE